MRAGRATRQCSRRWRCSATCPGSRSRGVLAVRRLLAGMAGDQVRARRRASRSGSATCRPRTSSRWRDERGSVAAGRAPTPSAELAEAAGYDDPERWWEDVVEHVPGPARLRRASPRPSRSCAPTPTRPTRATRSARRTCGRCCAGPSRTATSGSPWSAGPGTSRALQARAGRRRRRPPAARAAQGEGRPHLGALDLRPARLRLRLRRRIRSPGWYDHLFSSTGQPIERWLTKAAAVLRDEGVPASSAHVIESVRLAEALAALRGRPLAGLEEVTEAARAVLCEGSDLLTALIQRRLVVGERLGAVPPRPRWCRCSGTCGTSSAACGCGPRRRPATSTWTCASRTTWPAAICCTGSPCSACPGARRSRAGPGTSARSARAGS